MINQINIGLNNVFINMDFSKHTDQQLKRDAFQILALATIPMQDWFPVFSNAEPDMMKRPGLRCKTFYTWFPTMLDILKEEDSIVKELYNEIAKRNLDIEEIKNLTSSLIDFFKKTLANFSREEQMFLRDRRLQHAHGFLSMYFKGKFNISWFNPGQNKVINEEISLDDYQRVLEPFYQDMSNQSLRLLNRFVTKDHNDDGYNLMKFYADNLRSPKIEEIGKRLGVVK